MDLSADGTSRSTPVPTVELAFGRERSQAACVSRSDRVPAIFPIAYPTHKRKHREGFPYLCCLGYFPVTGKPISAKRAGLHRDLIKVIGWK
jgi:hypothetical protein